MLGEWRPPDRSGGLPLLKPVTEDRFKRLLANMDSSEANTDLGKEAAAEAATAGKRKAASAARSEQPKRGRGRGGAAKVQRGNSNQRIEKPDDAADADKEISEKEFMSPVAGGTFLEFLDRTCQFMTKKIDSRQVEKIQAFRQIAIYAALMGEVTISSGKGGAQRVVTKFSQLRALFKRELYRYAKLVPRPSDVDFAELALLDMAPIANKEKDRPIGTRDARLKIFKNTRAPHCAPR